MSLTPNISKTAAGMKGQKTAEDFLRKNGAEILERNYRTRTGEIDLIAKIDGYVAFIEVKFRKNTAYGLPCESVGSKKQQKIIRTALYYIASKKLENQDFRFDVVEVLEQSGQVFVNHITDAFGA